VRWEALNVADRIPTQGGQGLGQNPFAALDAAGLPSLPATGHRPVPPAPAPERNRGRVDITREKGGRGGKTVTVVDGFTGIGLPEKENLMRKIRAAGGCGGTVKEGRIEIQGDQRDTVARILSEAGFRPVFAGG
jgi:translation initiation factor 1